MKPDKPAPSKPLDQNELQKLPTNTMAKSMRDVQEIMADYIVNPKTELAPDEQRLLDLKLFELTGKHLPQFEEKVVPEPAPTEITIGKHMAGAPNPTVIGEAAKAKPHQSIASTSESVS